jgi:hypothetical protein
MPAKCCEIEDVKLHYLPWVTALWLYFSTATR